MRLSAVDIESRQLVKKPRLSGYSVREVEEFRQEIVDNYEELLVESARLKEQLEGLTKELERYRGMEHNLNESLVLGQRTAEDMRQAARQESAAIVRDAEAEAREVLRQARQDRIDLERDLADLMGAREGFLQEFRALLYSHLQRVEERLARLHEADEAPADGAPAEEPQENTSEAIESEAASDPPPLSDVVPASGAQQQPDSPGSTPPTWLRKSKE